MDLVLLSCQVAGYSYTRLNPKHYFLQDLHDHQYWRQKQRKHMTQISSDWNRVVVRFILKSGTLLFYRRVGRFYFVCLHEHFHFFSFCHFPLFLYYLELWVFIHCFFEITFVKLVHFRRDYCHLYFELKYYQLHVLTAQGQYNAEIMCVLQSLLTGQ